VPAAAQHPAAPVPLLVVLHGGGGSGAHFEQVSGFDAVADGAGFITAYPDAVRPPGDQVPTWNAGDCCGYAARTGVDDVAAVHAVITQVMATHRIDPARVFVAGYSNGGMLAYRVACQLARLVAAVGVQSATLEFAPCRPAHPVSLLHIHGTADDHVPLAGGQGSAGRSRADFAPPLQGAATIATEDGCGPEPPAAPDAGNPARQVRDWQGCPAGVAVEFVTVQGAGTPGWRAPRSRSGRSWRRIRP
jgi:polyhydroxybutyrate depolymerase